MADWADEKALKLHDGFWADGMNRWVRLETIAQALREAYSDGAAWQREMDAKIADSTGDDFATRETIKRAILGESKQESKDG